MELISDEKRAMRAARVYMDDIGQYYPKLVEQGIKEHNIFELMHEHIEEARLDFNKRVSPEIAASKIFDYAIVDVLIKRAYKYESDKGCHSEH
jgi:hypothetical protein